MSAPGFTLPLPTRAAALAAEAPLQELCARLLALCDGQPLTALAVAADAVARQCPDSGSPAALLAAVLAEHPGAQPPATPRVRAGAGHRTPASAPAKSPRVPPPRAAAAAPASAPRPAPAPASARVAVSPAPSSPNPRSLLKGQSVVAYLQGDARPPLRTPPVAATRRPAARPAPEAAAKRPAAGKAAAAAAAGEKREVDVAGWLAARKEKAAVRDGLAWAAVSRDARFIEKLERAQEQRNKALGEEAAAAAVKAAAATGWQAVPFAPAVAAPVPAVEASAEEALFRRDAERLFGETTPAAAVPIRGGGGGVTAEGAQLSPTSPGSRPSGKLAQVVNDAIRSNSNLAGAEGEPAV